MDENPPLTPRQRGFRFGIYTGFAGLLLIVLLLILVHVARRRQALARFGDLNGGDLIGRVSYLDNHDWVGQTLIGPVGINLSGSHVHDEDLSGLSHFPLLTDLDVSSNPITNRGLRHLKNLPLRFLNLSDTEVGSGSGKWSDSTTQDLRDDSVLPHLTRLEGLALARTRFSDQDLGALSGLKQLEYLDLSATKISDEGLRHLASFPLLEQLDLNQTQITGPGLRHLPHSIWVVTLLDTDSTDAGLASLAALPNLKTCIISNAKITDDGFAEFKRKRNLSVIHATSCQLTDAIWRTLAVQTDLSSAVFDQTRVTGVGIRHLNGTRIIKLSLAACPVSDAGLAEIATLGSLMALTISQSNITDAGLSHLRTLKKLRSLDLTNCQITDLGLAELAGMLELFDIKLQGTGITTNGLRELVKFPELSILELDHKLIADSEFPEIMKLFPKMSCIYYLRNPASQLPLKLNEIKNRNGQTIRFSESNSPKSQ
jgi:Leucine-rich repeat (LRR) protein